MGVVLVYFPVQVAHLPEIRGAAADKRAAKEEQELERGVKRFAEAHR